MNCYFHFLLSTKGHFGEYSLRVHCQNHTLAARNTAIVILKKYSNSPREFIIQDWRILHCSNFLPNNTTNYCVSYSMNSSWTKYFRFSTDLNKKHISSIINCRNMVIFINKCLHSLASLCKWKRHNHKYKKKVWDPAPWMDVDKILGSVNYLCPSPLPILATKIQWFENQKPGK